MLIGVFWMVALNRSAVTVISSRPELSSEAAVVAAWAQWVPQTSNAKLAIARGVVTRRMNAAFIPESPLLCCALWGARTVPVLHAHTNSLRPHRPLPERDRRAGFVFADGPNRPHDFARSKYKFARPGRRQP